MPSVSVTDVPGWGDTQGVLPLFREEGEGERGCMKGRPGEKGLYNWDVE